MVLVEFSQLYSNTFQKVAKYKCEHPISSSTSYASSISKPRIKNNHNETEVHKISQKQKILSEVEIQTICKKYQSGASVYKLAEEFECHRRTISDTLKRNGIEVSHKATAKPELVKKIIELYAEYKTPKEVGEIVGVNGDTVRRVLKENGIYIRKSWEYTKK